MHVLIAPDKFAGTLSAVEAAHAIAEGWAAQAPDDELHLAPMADGGPGFVSVLHESLGGDLVAATVRGPLGAPTPVTILRHEGTAYVESAQACGLHLVPEGERDPERSSTYGVGEAIAAAADSGADRVVVGLGGSASNDGGAGLLAALGADADVPLDAGVSGLAGIGRFELEAARKRLDGVDLVMASDVDNVLLGMFGATKTFGPQKGVAEADIPTLDALLDAFVVAACGPTPPERRVADAPGAGAAGGLGFGLLLLGAQRQSGIELVAEAAGIPALARRCDVVVTGEGAYDFSSRGGKVVYGVAQIAAEALRPCVVVAGQVLVGSREMRAMGVESAYAMVDVVGEEASFADPAGSLGSLSRRVARTWSR
ncbi:glycerate kinase family protein [Solicola gregarius]|uniref:Glycerate kinase n=1 Tax=Solicola gregarius TaxID=2908642 RepID=A0AA46TJ33_9ACTN|nr:glycerate kinase [Solicola gregarius]UYM05423.1 glycerate kinase [Solicola gregarius]